MVRAGAVRLVLPAVPGEARSVCMHGEDDDVAALVLAARRHEASAYAKLFSRFRRAVHAAVLARAPDGDGEDAVQEAFLTAWRRIDDLDEPAAFGGWILQIARRTAIDHRRRARAVEVLDAEVAAPEAPPTAEAKEVLRALLTLPEAYRETLVMRLVEGMTGPEIAEATGMQPESVRVNLCRGMKLLRAKLGGEVES